MDHQEMKEKIENVKNQAVEFEIFAKHRPPEEFGDAVRLYYNQNEHTFRAEVFDPDTNITFSEQTLPDDMNKVQEFITASL